MEPRGFEDPSAELERLAEEQINDLDTTGDERTRRGRERRERVLALYGQGALRSAQDNYFAALVMLYGDDIAHFELAKTFGQRASVLGEPRAWSVIAAAWDRSLLGRGKPQRFGTQFVRENGRWSLGEVDPRITDMQRALYGVPPLWVQRQNAEQLQRREEEDS
ncbi:MAG: hypothetical protein JST60_07665 [Chloroflexi bacterium SZAS-1]|jgi:hypothetical protein|nr:hypothetical protein [Chloroflexi bacterium SZAS-1]